MFKNNTTSMSQLLIGDIWYCACQKIVLSFCLNFLGDTKNNTSMQYDVNQEDKHLKAQSHGENLLLMRNFDKLLDSWKVKFDEWKRLII